jgi:hypothetical protein
MRRFDRLFVIGLCLFAFSAIPAIGFAAQPTEKEKAELYDCGKKNCSEWAPKGENTCRTCSIAQCKKQNGNELLVGEKKQSQCFEGHGAPPSDEEDAE